MYSSELTHRRVLPQPAALEFVSADNPGVGTKRDTDTTTMLSSVCGGTGVQHGRGETTQGASDGALGGVTSSVPVGAGTDRGRKASTSSTSSEVVDGAGTGPRSRGVVLVPVLGRDGAALMPTHPARARKLLARGRAVVVSQVPFVIRLKDKAISDGSAQVQRVELGIDPGSKHTGLAVFTVSETVDESTGEICAARSGLFGVQVDHRGHQISEKLTHRAQMRRGRRSRKTRYRAPRFLNRTKSKGWLAPSLQHRVDGTLSMVSKLRRWFPIVGVHQELVRFDMQALENPEIAGVEYQQGTLAGFEVREYLLAKFGRACVYCDAKDVPLNIDHVHPRSKGGTNRVSNLVLACIGCNQAKSNRPISEFVTDPKRLARVLAWAKRPLRDAAAVNVTRWALYRALQATGLPVSVGTGGRTKYNRTRARLPKTHALDALCVGDVDVIGAHPGVEVVAAQTGRGMRQRILPDRFGFARGHRTRVKVHHGFQTGDLVRAVVPSGKRAGTHTGRVAVRASGSFNIGRAQGVHHRHITLIQRNNGWNFTRT